MRRRTIECKGLRRGGRRCGGVAGPLICYRRSSWRGRSDEGRRGRSAGPLSSGRGDEYWRRRRIRGLEGGHGGDRHALVERDGFVEGVDD